MRVTVSKNGPYIVTGAIPLATQTIGVDPQGGAERWIEGNTFPAAETYALCRCGQSSNKPFCDGTHTSIGFDGAETASREPHRSRAKEFDGPVLTLTDVESLCAVARFCDPAGQVWMQVKRTDQPAMRASFLRQVGNCPSGRLVAWDKATGEALEPVLPRSIGVVEDPAERCSGPLWLRGGVAIVAADGFEYEVRNRVTLCRCGQSMHKPFCDGAHMAIKIAQPA